MSRGPEDLFFVEPQLDEVTKAQFEAAEAAIEVNTRPPQQVTPSLRAWALGLSSKASELATTANAELANRPRPRLDT